MNTPQQDRPPITELRQQFNRLIREFERLVNVFLDCMFALTPKGTKWRRSLLIGIFFLLAFLFGFFSRDVSEWNRHVSNVLFYVINFLNPTVRASFTVNPIREFLNLILDTYENPAVLRYLPIFMMPFIVALQFAAIYLADLFELKQVKIARDFIMQVAIWGGSNTIRIREGEIEPKSEESPVYLIGGPGSVVVELDSAALFERPDGRPRVIGPTVNGPVVLDGFDRFRQAIDLRDHRTESLNISSRSLDGIQVQTHDVSFLFSVLRGVGNQRPLAERPYPFLNNRTIELLVYNDAALITRDGPRPADRRRSWANTMTILIRGALAGFMSEHELTEYLASFGMPEVQAALEQANTVRQSAQRVLPPEGPLPSLPLWVEPPGFIPRPDVRARLFGEFAQAFPFLATQRGVELHWVGIGSWKTPNQIVPEQHLEAWLLSVDNQTRRGNSTPDPDAQYITRFIQDVPLARFAKSLKKQRSHRQTMFSLLIGYREQFMRILNIMEKKQEDIEIAILNRIIRALRHINRILGWPGTFNARWVPPPPPLGGTPGSRPTPPPPPGGPSGSMPEPQSPRSYSPEEYRLFNDLLLKTRNIETTERLLEYERRLTPNASELELIRNAIRRWEDDNR